MRRLLILFTVMAAIMVSCDTADKSPLDSGSVEKGTLSIVIADNDSTGNDEGVAVEKKVAVEAIDQLEIRILASDNSVVLTRTLDPEDGVFRTTIELDAQNDLKVLCIGMSDGSVEKFGIDEDVDVAPAATSTAVITNWNKSYIPAISTISPSPSSDGNYSVVWTPVHTATQYDVQVASNAQFTGATTEYSGDSVVTEVTGKAAGTYYYRVRATNEYAVTSAWSDGVSVVVNESGVVVQAPVMTDPGQSVQTGTAYSVTWNAVSGAESYTIEEATSITFSGAVQADISGTSASFTHDVSDYTTYYYRVRTNAADGASVWSDAVDMVILPEDIGPDELAVPIVTDPGSSVFSGVEYTLAWATVEGATSYTIEEDTSSSFSDPVSQEISNTSIAFSHDVSEETIYYYRVRANDSDKSSSWSNISDIIVKIGVQVPVVTDPGASVLSGEEYTLTWTAIDNSVSYTVEEATSATFDDAVSQDVTGTSVTYTHDTTESTAYYYRVRANFADDQSAWSNAVDMLVVVQAVQLQTPVVTASSTTVFSGVQYTLSWDAVPSATLYIVEESTSSAFTDPLQTITSTTSVSYMHEVDDSTEYYYRIKAVGDTGVSAWSDVTTITITLEPPVAPVLEDPGESVASDVEYTLSWGAVDGADMYVVEESTTDDFSENVVSVNADDVNTAFTHSVEEDTVYYYRVLARNNGGDSAWSNVVDMTVTPAGLVPAAPTDLAITDITASSIALTWTDNSTDEDGFSIEFMTFDSDWSEYATVDADVTSYRVLRLGSNTEYSFRVRAYRDEYYSDYSNDVTDTTLGLIIEGRIVYTSFRDNDYELYLVNADGSGELRLTDAPGSDTNASWSPDGSTIIFQTERNGIEEIYLVNDDGTNQRKLIDGAYPSFSPDGSQIVYEYQNDVWVADADGTDPVQLTDYSGFDGEPSFSPDGTQILFVSDRADGDWEIYIMDADGANVQRLTNHEGYDQEPEFSPDGYEITFSRVVDGIDVDIYVMEPDGTNVRQLTEDADSYSSSWSPNGAGVVFTSRINGKDEIFIMDSYGGNVTQITNGGYNSRPEWSPF